MVAMVDGVSAIVGGRVIDGTGADPIENGVVVIENGHIAAIGKDSGVRIPRGASVYDAADHGPHVMQHRPIGCEGMDDRLVKDIESIGYESDVMQLLPDGQGFLLVEFGGDSKDEADSRAHRLLTTTSGTWTFVE